NQASQGNNSRRPGPQPLVFTEQTLGLLHFLVGDCYCQTGVLSQDPENACTFRARVTHGDAFSNGWLDGRGLKGAAFSKGIDDWRRLITLTANQSWGPFHDSQLLHFNKRAVRRNENFSHPDRREKKVRGAFQSFHNFIGNGFLSFMLKAFRVAPPSKA